MAAEAVREGWPGRAAAILVVVDATANACAASGAKFTAGFSKDLSGQ